MNPRIVRGLLYEHITRTWPFMIGGIVMGTVAVLWLYQLGITADEGADLEPAIQTLGLFVIGVGLLYVASDGDRLTCDVPPRNLLLPVSSFTIAFSKVMYNATVIFVSSVVLRVVCHAVLPMPSIAWWYYPSLSATVFAVLQVIAFATGTLGDWSFGILFAVFVAIITGFDGNKAIPATDFTLKAAPIFTAAFLLSWMMVHLQRTGRWNPQSLLSARPGSHSNDNDLSNHRFSSAFAAQQWFEERRMRIYFAVTFVSSAFSIGLVGVIPRMGTERFIEDYSTMDRILWAIGQFGMMLPFVFILSAFFAGGVMSFQNFRMQFGPMQSFIYLRPMSSGDLARARIHGTLRGLARPFFLATASTIMLCSIWFLIDKENPSTLLTNRWSILQLSGILSLIFVGVATAAWAAYWGLNISIAVILFASFGLLVQWLEETNLISSAEPAYLLGLFLAAILMCALFAVAVHRKYLPLRRLVLTLSIAVIASAAFWFATYWDDIWSTHEIDWNFNDLPQYALFALFIALPTATIPLTLHWARHR